MTNSFPDKDNPQPEVGKAKRRKKKHRGHRPPPAGEPMHHGGHEVPPIHPEPLHEHDPAGATNDSETG